MVPDTRKVKVFRKIIISYHIPAALEVGGRGGSLEIIFRVLQILVWGPAPCVIFERLGWQWTGCSSGANIEMNVPAQAFLLGVDFAAPESAPDPQCGAGCALH